MRTSTSPAVAALIARFLPLGMAVLSSSLVTSSSDVWRGKPQQEKFDWGSIPECGATSKCGVHVCVNTLRFPCGASTAVFALFVAREARWETARKGEKLCTDQTVGMLLGAVELCGGKGIAQCVPLVSQPTLLQRT